MPKSITRITKVIDIGEVVWEGILDIYEDASNTSEWGIKDKYNTSKPPEFFDAYFEKMQGKRVRLTLKNLDDPDEKDLILV